LSLDARNASVSPNLQARVGSVHSPTDPCNTVDGSRFVLVEGLHRLEACKALGETTVPAYLVQARQH
jgi:hypothetical protein